MLDPSMREQVLGERGRGRAGQGLLAQRSSLASLARPVTCEEQLEEAPRLMLSLLFPLPVPTAPQGTE